MIKHFALIIFIFFPLIASASPGVLWEPTSDNYQNFDDKLNVKASHFSEMRLNEQALLNIFKAKKEDYRLQVPLPDKSFIFVTLKESSQFNSELAAKYPLIKSFVAYDDFGARIGSFSYSPFSFNGMFRYEGKLVFLDPKYRNNSSQYLSYYKEDARQLKDSVFKENFSVIGKSQERYMRKNAFDKTSLTASTADTLRTYRIAITANGEYSEYHGGTKESVLSAINVLLTRINEIYLVELAVRFELIADNDKLIFLDASSDEFENNAESDLETNQTLIDREIGSSNYDIGHIVNTAGGGVAGFGVVCSDGQKARGLTGSSEPTGDAFHVDFVAHEIGHQLGGSHSFNGKAGNCGTRTGSTAFEPGSGSTIMGYAGICDTQNLQSNTDATFHIGSIDQINTFISGNGSSCVTTSSIDNTQPTVEAGSDYVIPANTPFVLSGEASDANGDTLSYMWEQLDPNGVETNSPEEMVDNGSNPLFRSWLPSSSGERYLPRFADVIANTTVLGETYPTTTRTLNFKLTVRDSKGGVGADTIKLKTIATGNGFKIISPSGTSSWQANTSSLLMWKTSNSEKEPISCSTVDLSVSNDSGSTFESFETGIENDGIHVVTAPATSGSNYRLRLSCSDNVFYTVTPSDISINEPNTSIDSDGDGMSDEFENENGLDPEDPNDANLDGDEDGLSNLAEFLAGTKPNDKDSDNDGIPDNVELVVGLDPNNSEDASGDLDGDGVNNLTEYTIDTDLLDSDSAPNIDVKNYDFETETGLSDFELTSDNSWVRAEGTAAGGSFSLTSASIAESSESVAQYNASNFANSELTFDYRVSSEADYDFLQFEVDGNVIAQWSGDVPWSSFTYKLAAGDHSIKWRYKKDEVGDSGYDKAWIDNVVLRLISGDAPVTEPPGDGDGDGDGGSQEPEDKRVEFDFDNDDKADVAVRRGSNFFQYIKYSGSDDIGRVEFGRNNNDIPITGDFDGDGIFDVGVRRPSTQFWYIKNSSGKDLITENEDGITRRAFGLQQGDIPVPADYDGDGKTDIAVRRPSTQFWYILNSSGVDGITGNADGITRIRFGSQEEDIPVVADYDGDGKADIAVRRPSTQFWYVKNSSGTDSTTGHEDGITRLKFGLQEADIPVPADYDGDGKTDFAVRRPSTFYWYIRNSSGTDNRSNSEDGISRVVFGKNSEDIPVVADYDGDGRADLAVRRTSNQFFYIQNSSGSSVDSDREDGIQRINFGLQEEDIPIAAPVLTRMEMASSD